MREIFFIAMIIASVSGITIAEVRVVEPAAFESFVARPCVVFEIDAAVGSIDSNDAKLAIALLVAGSARSSRRRNLRARLRACPPTGNARQDRGRCMKSRSRQRSWISRRSNPAFPD